MADKGESYQDIRTPWSSLTHYQSGMCSDHEKTFGQSAVCITRDVSFPRKETAWQDGHLDHDCTAPRDGGAWWAAVYEVAQSRTRLKRLSSSSSSKACKCFSACASQSPRFSLDCKQFPLWATGGAGDTAAALRFPAVINDPRTPAVLKHRGLGLFQSPHWLPACTTPIRGPVSAELPRCGGRGALWPWHSSG